MRRTTSMSLAATLALTATLACTGALAQNASAPTEAQRALLLAHYKAYGAAGDAAAILPTTTTDNWANCGANGAACQTRQELIGMLADHGTGFQPAGCENCLR